jgi:Na+/melibiose symporter-like transporter
MNEPWVNAEVRAPRAGPPDGPAVPDGAVSDGAPDASASPTGLDPARLRSFIGLSLGLVGPRANLAVSGVLLTLLVESRAASAVAITFALTANRLVGWIAYPVLGRASDRTKSAAGRRAPYMAAGLLVMGVCTWCYTLTTGYWPLVLLIVLVKTASVVFGLTNVAVIPETFGKSRTIKAAAFIGVVGALVSLLIKGTVIATWKPHNPATWGLAFHLAGGFMVAVAFIVLLLVRESPAAKVVAEADRHRRSRPWRDELGEILAGPNAKVLVSGLFVFWAGLSATGYLAIVYFDKVLHAGANVQFVAGWLTGIPVLLIGVPLGYVVARMLTRKQVAVLAPLAGAVVSMAQFFCTHMWQTVVLAFIGAPMFTAFFISLAPMLLQLLPRSGGIGELLGKLVAPFSLFAIAFSFLAAYAVDATGTYRVIWVFPAVAGLTQAVLMVWLRVPPGHERTNYAGLWERMSESLLEQVTGEDRSLLGGVVSPADADAASAFQKARRIFGNPYDPDDPGDMASAALRHHVAHDPPPTSGAVGDGEEGAD